MSHIRKKDKVARAKVSKKTIPREESTAYIHVRVNASFKEDLLKRIEEEETNLTSFVINSLETAMYEEEEEEEDDEDYLLDEILTAMQNLERRIEIRLSTLQDTFNALIGKLIDFERVSASGGHVRGEKFTKHKSRLSQLESDNILQIDPESVIYQRVKRYIESKGINNFPSFNEITAHLETDGQIKEYLDAKSSAFPGWKETLIKDAIDEAVDELGIADYVR